MSKMLKIDQIHLRAVMLCMSKMSNIDQIHLRAVMLCYVCRRCIALNALNTVQKIKAMSKMSKIDQIHLRAVMLCMSETSKMGKEHTHTFWLITSLILNGFSIPKSFGKLRLRAFQPYHQILCMSKHVEDVEDRSNTPKGCNAMYVEDVEDRSNTPKGCNAMLCMSKMSKMHSIECIEYCTKDQSNVEDVEDRSNTPKGCNAMYVGDLEDGKRTYTHILAHNFLNT